MQSINTILLLILLVQVSYLMYKILPMPGRKDKLNTSFVDTSALMDGRIVTAAQTGFIPNNLVIPKSVIAELQYLADQADADKRLRARRGLDAISELQEVVGLQVNIIDDGPTDEGGVDERLIELAKKHQGSICTIDFNLNKVATVQGVRVLNINELAGSIRMAFLPGETLDLALTQKGQDSNQAVGYLADGTMVVVDKASQSIGKTIEIEVIRSLQTAAGRMLFAKLTKPEQVQQKGPSAPARLNSAKNNPERTKSHRTSASSGPSEASAQPTPNLSKPVSKSPKPQRRRAKRNGEDSLIELVNKQ